MAGFFVCCHSLLVSDSGLIVTFVYKKLIPYFGSVEVKAGYHWHRTSTRAKPDRFASLFWFIYVPTLHKQHPAVTFRPEPEQVSRYISHVAKVKPSSIVIYKRYHGFKTSKTEAELANLEKGKNGDYNGFMSPATARKVRNILENWLLTLEQNITENWTVDTITAFADAKKPEYYPTFVTLTLPARQMHDDNYIKRSMLGRFLIQLKNAHGVVHNFWRAEPQRNGNIHFHILCDRWIHWKAIRHEWNKILDDNGYIDAYRKNQQTRHVSGFKIDHKEVQERLGRVREQRKCANQTFDERSEIKRIRQRMSEAYEAGQKNNWSDPNSTDIHAIEKVENITAYVVKYVCKTDGADEVRDLNEDQTEEIITTRQRKIKGRIWGKSDGIAKLKHFEDEIATEADFHTHTHDNPAFDFVRHLEREAAARQEADPDDDSVWHDEDSGTTVYKLDQKANTLLRSLFPQLFEQYAHHYASTYATLYDKPAPNRKFLEIMSQFTDTIDSFTIDRKPNFVNYEKEPFVFGPVLPDAPF